MNDNAGTKIGTEEFTVRELQKPGTPTIPAGANNAVDKVNTSNVSNAKINVSFTTPNTEAVTLVVEITDTAKDNKASSTLKFTKEVPALVQTVAIENANLSSLKDGQLTVKAYVVDSDGNKSEEEINGSFTKSTEIPSVAVESVTRTDATNATVKLFIDGGTKNVYYMLKETNEVPSKEDIIAEGTKIDDITSNKQISLTSGLSSGKAYTLYIVACADPAGNGNITSDEVVSVTIPKNGLDQLAKVTNISSTQKDGVYTWNYQEPTDGLVGYKVILKKDSDIVAIKDIDVSAENEVNFFDELKKAEGSYSITIYAIGDGIIKATSDVSSAVSVGSIGSVVSGISVKLDNTTRTKLSWTTTGSASNVKDFTLQVARYNRELGSGKEYEIVETVNNITDYFYDVVDIINKHGIGQYGFVVIANPKDDVLKTSKKSTTNDITGTSPNYTAPIYYYINDTVKLEATEVTGDSVTLKGTLNKGDYKSGDVTYELYKSKDGHSYDKVTVSSMPEKGTFTHKESSLTDSSTWYFKIKTKIKDTDTASTANKNNRTNVSDTGFYDSEPITVKLPNDISLDATYTYKAFTDSGVSQNGELSSSFSNKNITYNNNTIYIKDNSGNVTTYTVEDVAEAETILNVLKQLKSNDKIKITDNKVSELELAGAKTYELGENASTATLKLSTNDMTVTGTVKAVTELTTAKTYDLSGLTITEKIALNVNANDAKIQLPSTANLTFQGTKTNVTLNGVKLTATKLGSMTYSNNTLTLDSTTNALSKIEGENDSTNPLSIILDKLPNTLELNVTNGINIIDSKENITAEKTITINSDNNTIDLSKVTFDNSGKVKLTAGSARQIYVILDSNSKLAGTMEKLTQNTQVEFTDQMCIKSNQADTTYTAKKTSSKIQLNTNTASTDIEIAAKTQD